MKKLTVVALLTILLCPPTQGAEPQCDIPGSTMHWIADYCMYRVGTDDFGSPEVSKCFTTENPKNPDTCANRKKYKKKICQLMKSYFNNSTEKCMANKTFSGPAVRNGGV